MEIELEGEKFWPFHLVNTEAMIHWCNVLV